MDDDGPDRHVQMANAITTQILKHSTAVPAYADYVVDRALAAAQARGGFILEPGRVLFRARIPSIDDVRVNKHPQPLDCGPPAPSLDEQRPGHRLTRSGSGAMYCALSGTTAIAEVRPWIGAQVWVGHFELTTQVELLDFTGWLEGYKEPQHHWQHVGRLLSMPVDERDEAAYAVTQAFGVRVAAKGVVGVAYDSWLHRDGINVLIFQPWKLEAKAELVQTHHVYAVQYESQLRSHSSVTGQRFRVTWQPPPDEPS